MMNGQLPQVIEEMCCSDVDSHHDRARSVAGSTAASTVGPHALEELVAQQVSYKSKIMLEQKVLLDATYLLEHTKATIVDTKKKLGGTHVHHQRPALKRAKLNRIENRIQHLAETLSKATRHNTALRSKVDELRQARLAHAANLERAKKELSRRREVSKAALREVSEVKEQIEQTHESFDVLKSQTVEEIHQFSHDIASLKTEMQPSKVAASPMADAIKMAPVNVLLHKHYYHHPKPHPPRTPSSSGLLNSSSDPAANGPRPETTAPEAVALPEQQPGPKAWKPPTVLSSKVAASSDDAEVERSAKLEQQERLKQATLDNMRRKELTEAFKRIRQEAQVESIDELLARHATNEETNFKALREVNVLNVELEALELERAELERSVSEVDKQMADAKTHLARSGFATLQQDLEATTAVRQKFDQKFEDDNAAIHSIQDSLAGLVDTLTVHAEASDQGTELLRQELAAGVTSGNVSGFLSFIEERINFVQQLMQTAGELTQAPAPRVAPDGTRLCVVDVPMPPTIGEFFADEPAEDEPPAVPLRTGDIKNSIAADHQASSASLLSKVSTAQSTASKFRRPKRTTTRAMVVRQMGYEGASSQPSSGLVSNLSMGKSKRRIQLMAPGRDSTPAFSHRASSRML